MIAGFSRRKRSRKISYRPMSCSVRGTPCLQQLLHQTFHAPCSAVSILVTTTPASKLVDGGVFPSAALVRLADETTTPSRTCAPACNCSTPITFAWNVGEAPSACAPSVRPFVNNRACDRTILRIVRSAAGSVIPWCTPTSQRFSVSVHLEDDKNGSVSSSSPASLTKGQPIFTRKRAPLFDNRVSIAVNSGNPGLLPPPRSKVIRVDFRSRCPHPRSERATSQG